MIPENIFSPPSIETSVSADAIGRELRSLRDDWADQPDQVLTSEDYKDPAILAAKRKNKRRAGAWFGGVIGWAEMATELITDPARRAELEAAILSLQNQVHEHNTKDHHITDQDVVDGDNLITMTLDMLGQKSRPSEIS